jgi:hypothetical protein
MIHLKGGRVVRRGRGGCETQGACTRRNASKPEIREQGAGNGGKCAHADWPGARLFRGKVQTRTMESRDAPCILARFRPCTLKAPVSALITAFQAKKGLVCAKSTI